jgi:hypothetical protein
MTTSVFTRVGNRWDKQVPGSRRLQLTVGVSICCSLILLQGLVQMAFPDLFVEQFNLTEIPSTRVRTTGYMGGAVGAFVAGYTMFTYWRGRLFGLQYFAGCTALLLVGVLAGANVASVLTLPVFVAGFVARLRENWRLGAALPSPGD